MDDFNFTTNDILRPNFAQVEQVSEAFNPEGGAYGLGRTHGHDHGHSHSEHSHNEHSQSDHTQNDESHSHD